MNSFSPSGKSADNAVIKWVIPAEFFAQYSGTSLKSKFIRRTGNDAPARLEIVTFAFIAFTPIGYSLYHNFLCLFFYFLYYFFLDRR